MDIGQALSRSANRANGPCRGIPIGATAPSLPLRPDNQRYGSRHCSCGSAARAAKKARSSRSRICRSGPQNKQRPQSSGWLLGADGKWTASSQRRSVASRRPRGQCDPCQPTARSRIESRCPGPAGCDPCQPTARSSIESRCPGPAGYDPCQQFPRRAVEVAGAGPLPARAVSGVNHASR
jgi:hypothetical protein